MSTSENQHESNNTSVEITKEKTETSNLSQPEVVVSQTSMESEVKGETVPSTKIEGSARLYCLPDANSYSPKSTKTDL